MEKTSTVMNPWPGLASYSGEDGRTLYGRSREINEVYSLIRNNLFITLYGRSGIGKTSLIKAGVSPYLKRSGYMPVYVRLAQEIRKEGETTFAGCLVRSVKETASKCKITLEESPTVLDYLSPDALWLWFVSSNFTAEDGDRIVPVIFLDQFEEVFSVDNMESILLLRQLCALVDGKRRLPEGVDGMLLRVRIVVSMRDDSLYRIEDVIDAYNLFPLRQKRYTLKSLGEKAVAEVISTPVEGLVSEEVMSQIIEKVGGMGSGGGVDPAVLSLMMSELFKKSAGGPITSDLVAGMDSEIVDSFYREGTRSIPDKEMEFLETHLVTSDGRRSVVAAADMCKYVTQQHLESLLEYHIISRLERGCFTDYELSHDVLCKRVTQSKLERERRRVKKRQWMMLGGVAVLLLLLAVSVLTIKELRNRRWAMLENQSRFVAEKALSLCEDGDNLLAQRLLCEVLPKDLEKENRPYVAAAEGALRKALESNSGILRGHTDAVMSVAFSSDGNYVVSASYDKTIRIWETKNGKCTKILKGHTDAVMSVAFSPDAKQIASASRDKTVRIWDTDSGECLKTLEGHSKYVSSVAFSPDGKQVVSASSDGTIRVWEVGSSKCLWTLEGHSGSVNSASFSPDGRQIVSASSDGTVRIWDVIRGKSIMTLYGEDDPISTFFSPDGKKIVTAYYLGYGSIRIWDIESRECLTILDCHDHGGTPYCVSFSPDGKHIVSAHFGRTICLWDAESGECLKTLEGHSDYVYSVAFSSDGRQIVSASRDHTVRLWDVGRSVNMKVLEGHTDCVRSAFFSSDGNQIVSLSADGTIRIWDAESGECVQILETHTGWARSASFSPDDKQIVSISKDIVCVWDVGSGECIITFDGDSDDEFSNLVIFATFSPNGKRMVSACIDGTVRIWDVVSGKCLKVLEGHSGFVQSAFFSHSGKQMVSASADGTIRIWDAESGECLNILAEHTDWVKSASFSSDDKQIVSSSNDHTVRIWDAASGECQKELEGHSDLVESAYFSPDGKYIVSASFDGTMRVWEVGSGKCLWTLEGHSDYVYSACFSPDGRRIVSASNDRTVRIWDFPPLQDLLDVVREKFKNNPLTPEEREKYYLQ